MLRERIQEKQGTELLGEHGLAVAAALGEYAPAVAAALAELDVDRVVARIREGDYRVWREEPTEIADRLGWMSVIGEMQGRIGELTAFADGVRAAGYRHVVLLGMGGSSLGPEVLRRTCGSQPGFPQLLLLDSTLPSWVEAVERVIDPAETLFLVSSKSGSSIEPNSLYAHFREAVAARKGAAAGENFAAITDPGTVLEKLGREQGFREVFLNPPEVGGRYSVLSGFGSVPAALIGLDLGLLLERAAAMRERCDIDCAADNPGAWLGAVMGILTKAGRDKLTLLASPGVAGFSLWVEQLLAESLGKEGSGIIPVAGEPELPPQGYGKDRFFVYLRLATEDNAALDARAAALAAAGHPVVRLELADSYDLGAEFYRWEYATAIAGRLLNLHPFDQPDVQSAKDMTDRALEEYAAQGVWPAEDGDGSLKDLLAQAGAGDYLAILAYLPDTAAIGEGIDEIRRRVGEKYGIAATAGFGPRYLHSTGQLHKGGPNSGLFLQLTADHKRDIAIPGRRYNLNALADAQAAGDLQALRNRGRRVLRIHLGNDPVGGLRRISAEV